MRKVGWGVLGCANFARTRTIPALLNARNCELLAVASRTQERADEFQAQFHLPHAYGSYEEMLADASIEAIYNPLPNALHAEWTLAAIRAGKHVLCEKPFAANAIDAQRVAEAAEAARVCVMEAFMWRFHPQHEVALQTVRDGAIGPVRLVRAAFTFSIARNPNVRLDASMAGGSVMDVGCYTVAGSRYYFQGEPTEVYARGEMDSEFGVDMSVGAILEFPGGRALIDCGFHLPFRCDLEVVGEKGVLRIPKAWLPDEEAAILVNGVEKKLPRADQYAIEFERFSKCIADGTPPPFGPGDAVKQMRVVDAVLRSLQSGATEKV